MAFREDNLETFPGLDTPQDYTLSQGSGITTITFTGTATSLASDPNNSNIPVGGVVASVGSTGGLGYQPLVAAGGTAIVSSSIVSSFADSFVSADESANLEVFTSS